MEVKIQPKCVFSQQVKRILSMVLLFAMFAATAATKSEAQTRLVVRDLLGLNNLRILCQPLGCNVLKGLGDPNGQLFLVTGPVAADLNTLITLLKLNPAIAGVELDQIVQTQGADAGPAPTYLTDRTPVNYYGTTVWRGYITQPAVQIIRLGYTQSQFQSTGAGVVVAVIDTGVDGTHPVLKNSVVPGYDFVNNQSGGGEDAGVTQSTVAVMDYNGGSTYNRPGRVSQSTVAVLDQSTVAVLDNPDYAAFGHGTMVAGFVHLVAPQAKIMPLRAFLPDGTGYNADILNAIYYAVDHGAKVINMSFNYTTYSAELKRAVDYAAANGVISVAAAGNSGQQTNVYPGAFKNVIDVASTDDNDIQSTFSNYGAPPVWLAAPGEGVMTTYPFGTYAAGWGTSFSAPLVSGTAALMVASGNVQTSTQSTFSLGGLLFSTSFQCTLSAPSTQAQAANTFKHSDYISNPQLGYGRLDVYEAVKAWRQSLGLY
jgi:subtilisin family serine protease